MKNQSSTELVDNIKTNYHECFQAQMPEISELTTLILRVHGSDHKELFNVHKLFHLIQINLVQHIIIQDINIFPLIKIYDRKPSEDILEELEGAVADFLSKEDDIEQLFKKLRDSTNGYIAPDDGCPTYDKTYKMLKEIETKVLDHIDIENNILLPRFNNN